MFYQTFCWLAVGLKLVYMHDTHGVPNGCATPPLKLNNIKLIRRLSRAIMTTKPTRKSWNEQCDFKMFRETIPSLLMFVKLTLLISKNKPTATTRLNYFKTFGKSSFHFLFEVFLWFRKGVHPSGVSPRLTMQRGLPLRLS